MGGEASDQEKNLRKNQKIGLTWVGELARIEKLGSEDIGI